MITTTTTHLHLHFSNQKIITHLIRLIPLFPSFQPFIFNNLFNK